MYAAFNDAAQRLTLIATFAMAHGWLNHTFSEETPKIQNVAKEEEKEKVDSPLLSVGDNAPALQVDQWLKGDPVSTYSRDNVYVIEFWATWCAPCIKSMPHLSELAERYAKDGLVVVALTTADAANTLEAVQGFVNGPGQDFPFRQAFCESQDTFQAFMNAAGQEGIPCSFVIDRNGKIAYIGLPKDLDYVLERVIKGEWQGKADADKLEELQKTISQLNEIAASDPKKALETITQIEQAYPNQAKNLDFAYAKVIALCSAQRFDEAKDVIELIGEKLKKSEDWGGLSILCGMLASRELNPTEVHREYALSMLDESLDAAKNDWQSILQIGMGYQMAGEQAKQVACFKKVIELCPDATLKQMLETALEKMAPKE